MDHSQRTTTIAGEKPDDPPISIPVVSWNVWFGQPHQSSRMDAIAHLVTDTRNTYTGRPVFLGMQELTPELSRHLYPKLHEAGYEIIDQEIIDQEIIDQDLSFCNHRYGCAIAVRTGGDCGSFINASDSIAEIVSSGFVPFSLTRMRRGFLWVHARVVAQPKSTTLMSEWKEVLFTTTHLESFLNCYYDGVDERALQLREIRDFCHDFLKQNRSVSLAMITGDLNWDDERYDMSLECDEPLDRPLLSLMGGEWIDAWLHHKLANTGITYDKVENPMLEGYLRRRFDRVLLLPRREPNFNTGLKSILHTQLIGKNALEGLTWEKETKDGFGHTKEVPVLPSEHYGLVVNVQI